MTNSPRGREVAAGSGHCSGRITGLVEGIVVGTRAGVCCAGVGWAEDHIRSSGEAGMGAMDAACYIGWAGHSWKEVGHRIVVDRDLADAGQGRCMGDAGEQKTRELEVAPRWKSIEAAAGKIAGDSIVMDEKTVGDSTVVDEKEEAFGLNSEAPRLASIRSFAPPRDG